MLEQWEISGSQTQVHHRQLGKRHSGSIFSKSPRVIHCSNPFPPSQFVLGPASPGGCLGAAGMEEREEVSLQDSMESSQRKRGSKIPVHFTVCI